VRGGVLRDRSDLLNLEVDLLFFDTTSTYFERDEPEDDVLDEDGNVIHPAFRTYGKSKDSRDDLPQVVIAMAVTRTGILDPGVVLAGEHLRSGADPPGQGRPARVEALPGGVGR
jgi:hypothetical protein